MRVGDDTTVGFVPPVSVMVFTVSAKAITRSLGASPMVTSIWLWPLADVGFVLLPFDPQPTMARTRRVLAATKIETRFMKRPPKRLLSASNFFAKFRT